MSELLNTQEYLDNYEVIYDDTKDVVYEVKNKVFLHKTDLSTLESVTRALLYLNKVRPHEFSGNLCKEEGKTEFYQAVKRVKIRLFSWKKRKNEVFKCA